MPSTPPQECVQSSDIENTFHYEFDREVVTLVAGVKQQFILDS